MKKTVVLLIITIALASLAFASLTDQALSKALNINNYISQHNLLWKAGANAKFLEPFEDMGITSLDQLSKLNGNRELPKSIKDKVINSFLNLQNGKINPNGLTTTDDLLMSQLTLLKLTDPVSDKTFYRLEPIRDQGWHGTCWAFSTVGSFESAYEVQVEENSDGNVGDKIDLSERWVAYHDIDWDILSVTENVNDANTDVGGNVYYSSYNNERYGQIAESYAPYSDIIYDNKDCIELNQINGNPYFYKSVGTGIILDAGTAKELAYSYEDYINTIKNAIKNYGSLSVSFSVPADFSSYEHGIYVPTVGYYAGGHAVTLVGWVDGSDLNKVVLGKEQNPSDTASITAEATALYHYQDPFTGADNATSLFWIIKNSWGYGWGDHGYYVIPAISEDQYNAGVYSYYYNNTGTISYWEIESDWMYVPLFKVSASGVSLDVNGDSTVNVDDFQYIVNSVGSTDTSVISKCDIAFPKNGKIDGNDVAAWVYMYNHK